MHKTLLDATQSPILLLQNAWFSNIHLTLLIHILVETVFTQYLCECDLPHVRRPVLLPS